MKSPFFLLFLAAVLLAGCSPFNIGGSGKIVTPSNTIISEARPVSGFTAIDFRTFGQVTITQGDSESLTIKGSDNIVPLIKTSVSGGVLKIQMEENVDVTGVTKDNLLTFTITVKNLNDLTVSGAGKVEMNSLTTSKLALTMSGAGQILVGKLAAEQLNVTISGVGNVEIAGETARAFVNISGAGPVTAPDLKIQTADVTISGIGSATLWVTGELTGNISGGGNISYYGNPQTKTTATGIGSFKALGAK